MKERGNESNKFKKTASHGADEQRNLPQGEGHNIAMLHNTAVHASHAVQASHADQPSSLPASQSLKAVHVAYAVQESSSKSVGSLIEVVEIAVSMGVQNPNCCWNLARATKAYERTNGKLPKKELEGLFGQWWNRANPQLPDDADYHEYLGDFLCCYEKAQVPLGQNALKNATAAARAAVREGDIQQFGEKAAKLLALCRELQSIVGEKPFYLSQRDAGAVMGTKDPYAPKKAIALLVSKEVLTVVKKGTYAGRQATYYQLREPGKLVKRKTDTFECVPDTDSELPFE